MSKADAVATRKDIDEVLEITKGFMQAVSERFDKVDERFEKIDERFEKIDERFDKIDYTLANIESRLTSVEENMTELRSAHERLLVTIDSFISRLERYETELTVQNRQFEKLLEWARKVSAKTGIPLENL